MNCQKQRVEAGKSASEAVVTVQEGETVRMDKNDDGIDFMREECRESVCIKHSRLRRYQ